MTRQRASLARLTAALLLACACAHAQPLAVRAPQDLKASYLTMREELARSPFRQPLILRSQETEDQLQGDIHAMVDFGFQELLAGLDSPAHWCDILILPINTKQCLVQSGSNGARLVLRIGSKNAEDLAGSVPLDFAYEPLAATPDHLALRLSAAQGPLGTSDYRIVFEAVALPDARSFVHVRYNYRYSLAGRLAMQVYLATAGSAKVGFTRLPQGPGDPPRYIGGPRAALERNTMRYYLAVLAYLEAARLAPSLRREKGMSAWIDAVENYPLQLHESERAQYLALKRAEIARQDAAR